MEKENKIQSFEEKFVEIKSGLRWDLWKGISFKNANELLQKAEKIKEITFDPACFSIEKTIVFFMDFFDILLRSRLMTLNRKQLDEFKKILFRKGGVKLLESEDSVPSNLLNFRYNDFDLFYPIKILEKVMFCNEKEYSQLIGFLTDGEYPQDTILHKWTEIFGNNNYLEIL